MHNIWKRDTSLENLNEICRDTAVSHLGIEIVAVGHDSITATMPVDSRTRQPFGLLHGGASVLLAETLGSLGANSAVAPTRQCVGIEINANHLRPVKSGTITGTARPVALGQKIQVWDIRIENEDNKLVCTSRLTLAVLP